MLRMFLCLVTPERLATEWRIRWPGVGGIFPSGVVGFMDGAVFERWHSKQWHKRLLYHLALTLMLMKFDSCFSQNNKQWGYWDDGWLGNNYINCNATGNGSPLATTANSLVNYGGSYYAVVPQYENCTLRCHPLDAGTNGAVWALIASGSAAGWPTWTNGCG